jgi:hypothetical protein
MTLGKSRGAAASGEVVDERGPPNAESDRERLIVHRSAFIDPFARPTPLLSFTMSLSIAEHNLLETAPPGFNWGLHPQAEKFLLDRLDEFLSRNRLAAELEDRMSAETSTVFFEWLDHLVLADAPAVRAELAEIGFVPDRAGECPAGEAAFFHPHAVFPRAVLSSRGGRAGNGSAGVGGVLEAALKPERVADVQAALNVAGEIEGPPLSRYRRLVLSTEAGAVLSAVERRAYRGFVFDYPPADYWKRLAQVEELWHTRPRACSEEDGFAAATDLAERASALVGRDLAGHLFFEAERAYWLGRNTVGRIQKHRQDRLGLGLGNHDHHTYRSSRGHFTRLIAFMEKLGFKLRERYHAGQEAGWGAQIIEHPALDVACFCDVDLSPEETKIDFAHVALPERDKLGTVGLWCGLHGEAFLAAGMHHLECRFDFEKLRADLEAVGKKTMKPFSDFDFLRQAFTEGERWPVSRARAEALRERGLISPEQCAKFLAEGAVGSHLENLQRRAGFKGFNQKSVSVIIAATDPRLVGAGA